MEQFAKERFSKAVDEADAEPVNFFNGMFDDKDNFQNTPENRGAIINRYGDELNKFIQDNTPVETQTKPADNKPNVEQSNDPYQKHRAIKTAANKFLEQLRAEGNTNKGTIAFKLQNALNTGNFAEAENILKQNNVAISESKQSQTQPSQIRQDPVTQNTTPENILSRPKQKSSVVERLIRRASKAVTPKTSREQKQKIGNAIIQLANQSGIAVPSVDFKSLQNGSSKKIIEWQARLSQAGAFITPAPQTQEVKASQPSLKERAKPLVERFKTQQEAKPIRPNEEERRPLESTQREAERDKELQELRAEVQSLRNVARGEEEIANLGRDIAHELNDDKFEDKLQREIEDEDIEASIPEEELIDRRNQNLYRDGLDDERMFADEFSESRIQNKINDWFLGEKVSNTQAAQAEEQVGQAQKEYQRKFAGQSQQAGELAQQGLAQTTAQNLQSRRRSSETQSAQAPKETPPKVQTTQPVKTPQERINRAARSPISTKRSERIKQGKAIKAVAKQNNINLPRPLEVALDEGSVKGIEAAQNFLKEQTPQPQETETAKSNDIRGNTAEVITGSRTPHKIQYRIVEALCCGKVKL